MKSLKKIGILLFAVCFLMLYPSVSVHAAEGTLQFSDPTAKVGEDVTVKAKISTGGEAIGDGFVTVTYDKAALEFVSGTNATGGDGTVKLEATGDGTVSELEYTMVFKALKEGATKLEVSDYTSYLYSDETLNLTTGDSTVTVEAGDGTSSESSAGTTAVATGTGSVEIDGVTYTIYNDFSDALVPDGCSRTTMEYNGETVNAILQETSGKCFVYLVEGDKDPVMALYNEKDNSFAITEMVSITDSSYIFLLGTNDGKGLPSQFKKTKLTVGTLTFPVWQNSESEDFYLMYAMNESGEESFYQYDTKDETYQRYPVTDVKEKSTSSSITISFPLMRGENVSRIAFGCSYISFSIKCSYPPFSAALASHSICSGVFSISSSSTLKNCIESFSIRTISSFSIKYTSLVYFSTAGTSDAITHPFSVSPTINGLSFRTA